MSTDGCGSSTFLPPAEAALEKVHVHPRRLAVDQWPRRSRLSAPRCRTANRTSKAARDLVARPRGSATQHVGVWRPHTLEPAELSLSPMQQAPPASAAPLPSIALTRPTAATNSESFPSIRPCVLRVVASADARYRCSRVQPSSRGTGGSRRLQGRAPQDHRGRVRRSRDRRVRDTA